MPKVFISYRRADSQYVTDAIYSEMSKHFGEDVFLDVDDIPPGVDFPDFLAGKIADVDAILVIIGQDWARIMEERADQFNDFVRIEVESALEQGKLVIPVLVKNANMPNFSALPESIRDLQRKNAVPVRRHPDLRRDCERLANGIERALNNTQQPTFTLPDLHWIDIPAGKVTLQENRFDESYIKKGQKQTFDVPAFAISKYPVANKQHAEYVKETGKEPEYWNDSKWNDPMQPVVGVNWHDAIDFCEWLSQKSGDKILLPTEQQWQRAAQGDDNRLYPWGNQRDASRCNNDVDEKGIGKTSPVTAYEGKGDSPYGVVDMTGNVAEWCITNYDTGSQEIDQSESRRVLRGGSWSGSRLPFFRVFNRYGDIPYRWVNTRGFRLVRHYD